jgi:hypothetical protein
MTIHTYPSKQMRLIVWWSCEDLTSFVGPIALFNYGLDFGAVVHSRRVLESVTSMLSLLTHLANRYYWFARNSQASIGLENTSVTI